MIIKRLVSEQDLDPKIFTRFSDNTLVFDTRFAYKIENGLAFSSSHRFEGVASDAYEDLVITNPSASGKKVYIVAIEISTMAQAHVDIYRNITITSNGTSNVIINLNFDSNNVSVCTVEYGGSYTVNTPVHQTVVPGGYKLNAIGSLAEVGERVIIPPGNNTLVRVTNKSTDAQDFSIRIIWWEE